MAVAVETHDRPIQRVSWSSIFVGVVVAMALEGVLTFVGNAIGLRLVNPLNLAAARTLDTGSILWTLGIPLGCLFVGGLLSGLLSGYYNSLHGMVSGMVVWALVGLFDVVVASLMNFGAAAARPAGGYGPYNAALWLMFFSAWLQLFGAMAGGLFAVRPRVREPFYREERRVIPQQ